MKAPIEMVRKSSHYFPLVFLTLFALLGGLTFAAPAQAISAGPCYDVDPDMNITSGFYCSGDITIAKEVVSIGAEAFKNNTNIYSLTFEERTTEPLSIGYAAFAYAGNLGGHLVFPVTTTFVGQYAFYFTSIRCYTNLSTVTITTENLDNYRQVPECGPYAVTYDLGGGTGTAPTQASGEIDATFIVASDVDISYSGYTFSRWNDGSADYYPTDLFTIGAQNVTLTAIWNEDEPSGPIISDLFFDALGGSFPFIDGNPSLIRLQLLDGYDFLSTPPSPPTRSGYEFGGWSLDQSTVITELIGPISTTLYALWTIEPVGGQVTVSSIAFATTPAVYQQSNLITVTVGETGVAGWVGFFQNGRSIPKCTKVLVRSLVATCAWKPANLGSVNIAAIFTPKSLSYTASARKTASVRVSPRT